MPAGRRGRLHGSAGRRDLDPGETPRAELQHVLGAGSAGLFTLTMTLPLDYGPTPEAAGKWTAMMLTGSYLFSAFGPYAAGVLRDVSGRYDWVFAALAVMLGLLLLLCLFLKPPLRHR